MGLFSRRRPVAEDTVTRYVFPDQQAGSRFIRKAKRLGLVYLLSVMLYMLMRPMSAHVIWLLVLSVIGFFPGCYWLMGCVTSERAMPRLTETARKEGPVRIQNNSRWALLLTGCAFAADIAYIIVNNNFALEIGGFLSLLIGTVCALFAFMEARQIVPTIRKAGKKD